MSEKITGIPAQSVAAVSSRVALFIGIAISALGVFMLNIAFDWIPMDPRKIHAPKEVFLLLGGAISLFGGYFLTRALADLRAMKRAARARDRHPEEPWLWDAQWDPRRIRGRRLRTVVGTFFGAFALTAFLSVFNWWAFLSKQGNWFVQAVTTVFDLVIALVFYSAVKLLVQYFRQGSATVEFESFPGRLGQRFAVGVRGLRDGPRGSELRAHLRFIEERYELEGGSDGQTSVVNCYVRYAETKVVPPAEISPSTPLSLEWDLPADSSLKSSLSSRPARFWQLELEYAGGKEFFLLPIY